MPAPDSKPHWFRLSPDRFVFGLLLVICLLWLSERFQWFGINHHKGWTVLIAVAAVGVVALVMLLWWAVSLIFHWRFQFGIRSLLTFCLASSIAAGWLAVEIKDAQRQAEAVERIQRSDGSVLYNWQVDKDNHPITNPEPPGSAWLRKMLGIGFFSPVVEVRLMYTNVTDVGLEYLKGLSNLQTLDLRGTEITDAELEHLEGLTHLRELVLDSTKITDAELKHLEGLKQLRQLWLGDTVVTDAGVKKLQQALPNCKIGD